MTPACIRSLVAALVASILLPLGAGSQQTPRRPNVLILLTDDQRADAVGALGGHVYTPNLDRLVRRGFTFDAAYCLGANQGAVCTPSRNMLMTGRSYWRWPGNLAPATLPNLPATFRAAGYETYHHGKRGNTATPINALFEHNRYLRDDEAERRSGEPGKEIADAAVRFLADRRDSRPLLMLLAFGNPHDPRVAAQPYLDRYPLDRIRLPPNFLIRHPFDNGELGVRDELLAALPRRPDEIRRHLRDYYATTTAMDFHIGRVLSCLTERGLDRETVILFTSDHGLAIGSHGLMGKQNLYEHSMRVPFVVAGPGIRHGHSDALAYLMDVFPTLCEASGVPPPPGLDGRSLTDVWDGTRAGVRERVFLAYREVQRAVRDERWKLIHYPRAGITQLFDLKRDPDERRNLYADPDQGRRVELMFQMLREEQERYGDPLRL